MDIQPVHQAMIIQEIHFPQENRALAVIPPSGTDTTEIVQALGIPQPKAVIMIAGGASKMGEHVCPDLAQLFTDGIAQVAASNKALIIDSTFAFFKMLFRLVSVRCTQTLNCLVVAISSSIISNPRL
jgi:hypothetical protein